MKLDSYGFVEMEQNPVGDPGRIGDSAAETGRLVTLCVLTETRMACNLSPFVTERGILRHPLSPWRENDTSSDQVAPLLAAACLTQGVVCEKILEHLADERTGNGDLITVGLWAQMRRARSERLLWVSDLAILGQALVFKLPWRWSDSAKKLESTEGSSADYLNFVNALAFAARLNNLTWPCRLAMLLTSKERVLERAAHYYKPEPNCEWVLKIYAKAVARLWG